MERYFVGSYDDVNVYVVPVAKREEWYHWIDCVEDDEVDTLGLPPYVMSFASMLPLITFTDPQQG